MVLSAVVLYRHYITLMLRPHALHYPLYNAELYILFWEKYLHTNFLLQKWVL